MESNELTEPGTVQRYKVCAAEIWCEVLGGRLKDLNGLASREINSIMRNMQGWERSKSALRFGKIVRNTACLCTEDKFRRNRDVDKGCKREML